jgi:hypothetical protein
MERVQQVLYMESCHHSTHLLQLAPPQLAIDVHDMERPRSGKTSFSRRVDHEFIHSQEVSLSKTSLADYRTLKRGQQRLRIHRDKEADPSVQTTTPSESPEDADEMGRLEEVSLTCKCRMLLTGS